MSDGMSEYWRNKRAYEREQKIMRDLYFIVRALLDNQPSPNVLIASVQVMLDDIDKAVAEATAKSVTQSSELQQEPASKTTSA